MRSRILLDTCVLVAASTFYASDDLEIRLEHPFYQQSISLISLIRKNLSSRMGITTKTIEQQSIPTFQRVIDEELAKAGINRKKDFPTYSFIKNYCSEKLKNIISCLVREPIEEEAIRSNYGYVDRLYAEKAEEGVKLTFVEPRFEKWTDAAARKFKGLARGIYKQQQKKEDYQLTNLIKNPVEPHDKRILSEAIYLSMLYNRLESEEVIFFIASTDNHFSPKRWGGGVTSRQITDAILKKFNIICDWSQQVEEMAIGILEGKHPLSSR